MTSEHGASRYTNDGCRCDICRAAATARGREYKRRLKARPKAADDPRHGTASFFGNHGCRCAPCTAAWAAAARRTRARKSDQ